MAHRNLKTVRITQARKISAEFFPPVDVEGGNELFWYIFDGEPTPVNEIDLRDDVPGLGLTIKEDALDRFSIIE